MQRPFIAAAIAAAVFGAALAPVAVQAEPGTGWRTRNTGLDTEGKCTRRAFSAMQHAGPAGSASGNIGVLGRGGGMHVYVLCQNGGAQATIFCAIDRGDVGRVCDTVSRFMVP